MSLEDRFIGCLLGVAIGDALGMPFEGLPAQAIGQRYGRVTDFVAAPRRGLSAGQFTDDTQMMLMHAESIVASGKVDPEDLAQRFMAWLRSGSARGIGRSTLHSIRRLMQGVPWQESGQTGEYSAGNGVAMRIAPVGLLYCRDRGKLPQAVEVGGCITHLHPEALKGGLAVAYAVAQLVTGEVALDSLLDDIVAFVGECEVTRNVARARELLAAGTPTDRALEALGTSGYVVHTVASALYCFLRTPNDFEETVIAAVMGGGDTDTTGAVAGAISGAFNGLEGIPRRWLEGVEERERIERLAGEIHEFV